MLRQVPHRVSTAHFGIVDIAAIAQRVVQTKVCGFGATSSQQSAPGIVEVLNYFFALGIYNRNHIALKIGDIVIIGTVVDYRQRCTGSVIGFPGVRGSSPNPGPPKIITLLILHRLLTAR